MTDDSMRDAVAADGSDGDGEEIELVSEHWDAAGSPLDRAAFNADGLLPAIIQQWDSREVLMLGWMDREALRRTLSEGRVTFWSRSRQEYWRKGDTSGNVQHVRGAALDCDADTLLVQVEQHGVACHTGTRTCFDGDPLTVVRGEARGPDLATPAPDRGAR